MQKRICFRFDGNKSFGMGHVIRCLNLIKELNRRGCSCLAIIKDYSETVSILETTGIKYFVIEPTLSIEEESLQIEQICTKNDAFTIVHDKLDSDIKLVELLQRHDKKVVTLDDNGSGAEEADLVINAIIDSDKLHKNKYYYGSEYIVLNKNFSYYSTKKKNISKRVSRVLLSFGGSDPENIVLKALLELREFVGVEKTIILGSAYSNERIYDLVKYIPNCNILKNISNMGEVLHNSDICLISGGITLYESMAVGVPAVVICQVDHQTITAARFAERGAVINLGLSKELNIGQVYKTVSFLISNPGVRESMSYNGRKLIDGQGLFRVVDLILSIK